MQTFVIKFLFPPLSQLAQVLPLTFYIGQEESLKYDLYAALDIQNSVQFKTNNYIKIHEGSKSE